MIDTPAAERRHIGGQDDDVSPLRGYIGRVACKPMAYAMGYRSNAAPRLPLRLRFHGRFSLQLAPANHSAVNGRRHRLDHDVVHHLAIAEALQEQPPE